MQTYIVQRGDTLYGISGQFGISIEDIKLSNNLTSNNIIVGQVLKIPSENTTSLYVVKSGDSLYSIARKYNTTVFELVRLNNLNTKILSVGQQLRIPINVSDDDYILYTVKIGDTLYSIAKKNNVSVLELVELNNLSTNTLRVGQPLKIPISSNDNDSNNDDYNTYVVQRGDTLYRIASMYGMSVDELIKINNLSSTSLSIGQVLNVKNNYYSDIPLGAKCYGSGYKEPSYLTYTVRSGDNLYSIAKKYNTSVDNLIELNSLTSNNLTIGQVLKIKEI